VSLGICGNVIKVDGRTPYPVRQHCEESAAILLGSARSESLVLNMLSACGASYTLSHAPVHLH
jgi:hypothetical protein